MTATLHIEHEITDYPTWKAAFDRFADARTRAGVTAHRIRVREDDPRQIVIDLDFDAPSLANAFSTFLHQRIWGTGNAPALVGTPSTRILIEADDWQPLGSGRTQDGHQGVPQEGRLRYKSRSDPTLNCADKPEDVVDGLETQLSRTMSSSVSARRPGA